LAILLIDMDEVVADCLGYVLKLHEDETGEKIPRDSLDDWDANGELLGHYFKREGLYRNLGVVKDAQMVLRELSINHRIFFVTAAPTPRSAMEKKEWVDEHFPWIGQKNVITTYDKYLIRGDLLLDDSPTFLPVFPKTRVLMEQPHNSRLVEDREYDFKVRNFMQFLSVVQHLEYRGLLTWCEVSQLKKHMERPL
jgi:5'-nucleotidase